MRPIFAAITSAFLAGCAGSPLLTQADIDDASVTPVYCDGKAQCDFYWRRAQVFVAMNAGYKIQVATDSTIETYGARDYSTSWAMKVIRIPKRDSVEEIEFFPSCGGAPLCRERPHSVALKFQSFLRAEDEVK